MICAESFSKGEKIIILFPEHENTRMNSFKTFKLVIFKILTLCYLTPLMRR